MNKVQLSVNELFDYYVISEYITYEINIDYQGSLLLRYPNRMTLIPDAGNAAVGR